MKFWIMLGDPHHISHALGFFVWLPLFLPCIPLLWNSQPDITIRSVSQCVDMWIHTSENVTLYSLSDLLVFPLKKSSV